MEGDILGYTPALEVKYNGTVLLSQYKLSYTREFRIEVESIQSAINSVYMNQFHMRQFRLTGIFAVCYLLVFIGAFVYIMKSQVDKGLETQKNSTGTGASMEGEFMEGGDKDDHFKKI